MEKLKLIIYREFFTKVRNRSFIILTFLSPFLIVAMGVVVAYLTKVNESTEKEIVVVDKSAFQVSKVLVDAESVKYTNLSQLGLDKVKTLVKENKYYGLLYIPNTGRDYNKTANSIEFFTVDAPSLMLIESIESRVANELKYASLEAMGMQTELIKNARFDVAIRQVNFSGEASSKLGSGLKIGLGMAAGYLIMLFIIVYGNSVMRSIIEEKASRIIEIIISSVKPFQLLMGKIIGNAFAGLLQFLIWGILVAVFAGVASVFLGVDITTTQNTGVVEQAMGAGVQNEAMVTLIQEVLQLPIFSMFFLFLFYFICGFFFYSAIYAAIGASVDSETDTQQFMLPVLIPLMLGVYVGFAAVISDPHGPISTVFSIIPLTSPIVMLMRYPFGVPWYEIAISILLLVLSFVGVVKLAAKIYRIGILMHGKKPTYKDLYKWLKY